MIQFGRVQFNDPTHDPPPCLDYLWEWFLSLNRTRDMDPVCYIKPTEFLAWQKLHRIKISPFELSVLERLDGYFVSIANKTSDDEVIPRDMSPDLFDKLIK